MNKTVRYMALMLSLALTAAPPYFQTKAAEYDSLKISTVYNADSQKLSVSGKLAQAGKKFVNIIIAPYGNTPTADNISDDKFILKTAQTPADGSVSIDIVMPDKKLENRYSCYMNADTASKKSVFATVKPEQMSDEAAAVNSAVKAENQSGVYSAISKDETASVIKCSGSDEKYIASYIYAACPKEGYDGASLINAYLCGEGLGLVKSGEIGVDEYLSEYEQYLGKDYFAIYDALPLATQNALGDIFVRNEVTDGFDAFFNDSLFVAEYVSAESPAELQKIAMKYFEENEISLDAYNAIGNSVYQERVFDNMYKGKASITNVASVVSVFAGEVAAQKEAADSASSQQGGGSSSGASTKGGTTGSIGTASNGNENTNTGVFNDMAAHWAKAEVETMYARGIVNGFEDGSFRPDISVTRAEFTKLIAAYLRLDVSGKADFSDVPEDSWYTGYVAAAAKAGIVMGSDNKFDPDRYITRQDAAVMLARVLTYKGKTYAGDSVGFNDEKNIAVYAKDAVNGLSGLGLIKGYNGGFAPNDNTTRAEAAALIMRVADYIG